MESALVLRSFQEAKSKGEIDADAVLKLAKDLAVPHSRDAAIARYNGSGPGTSDSQTT